MTWYKEIPLPRDINYEYHSNNEDFIIRKLNTTTPSKKPDFINDIVLQWIMCPFIFNRGVVYEIPINDSKLVEYTFNVLINLFNNVRGVYLNNELKSIKLEELNPVYINSFLKQVLHTNLINPLVKDFYTREPYEQRSSQIDVKLFEVVKEKYIELTKYNANSNDVVLWEFIKKVHIYDEITLFPTNWIFNNKLLESPFLIFLSRYASNIILTINNNDQNVRAITFK